MLARPLVEHSPRTRLRPSSSAFGTNEVVRDVHSHHAPHHAAAPHATHHAASHASHATHSHATHSSHASHATHTVHAVHASHASHHSHAACRHASGDRHHKVPYRINLGDERAIGHLGGGDLEDLILDSVGEL